MAATARGLVRPSYRKPGQAEYVNTDKIELDLEKAEWENQALRLRLGTLKSELDRALKQIAVRDQLIARLRGEIDEMSKKIPKGPLQPIGRLSLNLPLREIRFGDRVVLLSKAEIQVVAQLFARPGELIDTPELALGMVGNPSLSCIRSYLWRVRQKLEAVGAKGYLPVRYGYGSGGFALIDPDRESQPADTAGRRPHRRKPGGPHPFAQPTIEGFDPAKFRADRLAAGLTLTALAAASGVSRRTLSDWECVRQTPSPRVFQRVLDALRGDS